jgi:branched-chain amino acid transport system substrate-binding protein
MKKARMHHLVVVLTGFLLLTGLVTLEAAAQDKIRVGASISLTGKFAREGTLVKEGYDFWRDWANGRGGVNVGTKKYSVEIVYYDDKSDAMTSAKLTEKLITEDKVNFLLAPYSSGIAFATSTIGERYGYITIAGAANSDALYERGYQYLFSVMPPASRDFHRILELAMEQKPKPKTIAIMCLDNLFTILATDGLRNRAKEFGLEEVYYTKFPVKTTDFSGMLTVTKPKNPDLLFFGGFFEDSVPFIKQCKELNVNPRLYAFLNAPQLDDWPKILGKDGDYVFSVYYWARGMQWKGPYFDVDSFAETWQKKYGTPPHVYNAVGATSGLLLQIATEKAGTLNQTQIRDVLRKTEVTTFYGPFKWDEKGRNINGRLGVLQRQNQKIVSVDPPDPGAKLLYPTPTWDRR